MRKECGKNHTKISYNYPKTKKYQSSESLGTTGIRPGGVEPPRV